MIWWFFGRAKYKQKFLDALDDEWMSIGSSVALLLAPNSSCHGRELNATVRILALQLGDGACKDLQNDGK